MGDASRGCEYECDCEITVKEGPDTRLKKRMKLEMTLHNYVLIFTHVMKPAVFFMILDSELTKDLETLCLTFEGKPRSQAGCFALERKGDRIRFTLTEGKKTMTTLLTEDGIERLIASIKVKDHLDRYTRTSVSSREHNLIRAKDLRMAITHLSAKYAVDYLHELDGVFPARMDQTRYQGLTSEFNFKELRAAFKSDCLKMHQHVVDATGITWRFPCGFLDFFLNSMGKVYNPYNEPLTHMTGDQLLVLGTWMLRMG